MPQTGPRDGGDTRERDHILRCRAGWDKGTGWGPSKATRKHASRRCLTSTLTSAASLPNRCGRAPPDFVVTAMIDGRVTDIGAELCEYQGDAGPEHGSERPAVGYWQIGGCGLR